MSKKGTEYEIFVKEIYERLNSVDGLTNAKIRHDVVLISATGTEHQIDVYWTFEIGGIHYKVAVECKDYKNSVSIDKIRAFHDTLEDLGGVKGVFATTKGFQKGALEYAKKCGIEPVIIRKPSDEDWNGRVRDIPITVIVECIGEVSASFEVNDDNVGRELIKKPPISIDTSLKIEFDLLSMDGKEIRVNDSISLIGLINLLPRSNEDNPGVYHNKCRFKFEKGYCTHDGTVISVTGIVFNYSVEREVFEQRISGDELILGIVKDMCNNQTRVVKTNL